MPDVFPPRNASKPCSHSAQEYRRRGHDLATGDWTCLNCGAVVPLGTGKEPGWSAQEVANLKFVKWLHAGEPCTDECSASVTELVST